MKTLRQAFKELEATLVRNVANDLIQLEFHEAATDDEIRAYYSGAEVDRQALIDDTKRRLMVSQGTLRFVKGRMETLIQKYGEKKPTDDLAGAPQLPDGGAAEQGSVDQSA